MTEPTERERLYAAWEAWEERCYRYEVRTGKPWDASNQLDEEREELRQWELKLDSAEEE